MLWNLVCVLCFINLCGSTNNQQEIELPNLLYPYQKVYKLTENEPFAIRCPVESGEYDVSWTLNGKSLDHFKQHDGSIYISSVAPTGMQGNAVCVASNNAGAVQVHFIFEVYRAPYNVTLTANKKFTLMKFESFNVTCNALGNPSPHFIWMKNNQHYSNSSSISFTTLGSKDSANFTCIAINSVGNRTETFQVIINLAPKILVLADPNQLTTNTNVTIVKFDNFQKLGDKDYVVNAGDDIPHQCAIVGRPVPEFNWYQNIEIISRKNGTLHLDNITLSDNGIYKCASGGNSHGYLEIVFFHDVVQSQSIDTTNNYKIVNNSTYLFECVYDGISGQMIINSKYNLSSVGHNDKGIFKCKAGESKDEINLEIIYEPSSSVKPIKLKKIVRPEALPNYLKEIDLVLKTPFSMSCPLESGEYNVSWTINGKSIDKFKLPDQTIYIDSVKSNMKGEVQCVATNKAGSDYAVFDFVVSGPPFSMDIKPLTLVGFEHGIYQNLIELNENESFGLICKAKGNPPPIFHWMHNSMLHSVGETLQFTSVQVNNSGNYTCVAINQYGMLNQTYTIKVNVPVKIERANLKEATNINEINLFGISALSHIRVPGEYFKADYQEYVAINENETFVLDCKMSGHPTIKWFKNNEPLNKTNVQIITFINATVQDSGIYKCADSSFRSNLRILFYVIVKKKFSIESFTSSKSVYTAGDVISIDCKAKGNPVPQLTLYGPGHQSNSANTIKCIIVGRADFQEQNGTFYTVRDKIVTQEDLKDQSQYNIITYEFEDGQYVVTFNHIIKFARNDHQGKYTCTIRDYKLLNQIKGSSTINIAIKTLPYIEDNSTAMHVYYIQENIRDYKINCPIIGLPLPTVDWFSNGTKILRTGPFYPKGNQLRINGPSMANTGSYSCKHVNSSLEYNFKIQIIHCKVGLSNVHFNNTKDILIKEGETIQLNCTSSGKNIFWNEIVNTNNKTEAYYIVNDPVYAIVGDSSRTLMCTDKVEPTYGELFNIIVFGKPKIGSEQDTLAIKLGTNFTLNCKVVGNPEPKITWYKKIAEKWEDISKLLDFQQTSPTTLTKSKAQTLDNAQYKCVAENEFGQESKIFTVNVLDKSNYFSNWSKWSECSKTCGNGTQKRSRKCIHPSCNFVIDDEERRCRISDCPIHGGWSNWLYSKCSKPCLRLYSDKSEMIAIRKCNAPKPSSGGQPCRGLPIMRQICYVPYCDSDVSNLNYANCPVPYECCPDSFQYNNKTRGCEEIMPCDRKMLHSVCNIHTQICTNTGSGQFRCECKRGFKLRLYKSGNTRCYDVNECRQHPNPCGNKQCVNLRGSFRCI